MKMSTYLHSFAFAAAVLVSTAAYSSVLYVDSLADESADGDGASPETALAALDAAAATAADGDEIRILGGKGRCRRACVCHWLLNTGCCSLPLLGDWSWGEGEVFAAKNAKKRKDSAQRAHNVVQWFHAKSHFHNTCRGSCFV